MKKLSRILAPTDFSAGGIRALAHASAVAERTGAELHVLHVRIFNRNVYGWSAIPNVKDVERIVADQAREDMAKAIEGLSPDVVHDVVADTRAAPAILRYVDKHDIDLVVMGTHARKGISRVFLGSITAEVLRHTPTSLLAIGPEHAVPDDQYQHILAPVDFSGSATSSLQQASAIAHQHQAQLSVMHSIEPNASMAFYGLDEPSGSMRKHAEDALEKLLSETELAQTAANKRIVAGPAEDQIVAQAHEQHSDLIVMGTVGLSGLERLLVGSTTERVMRKAPCAVLAHRGVVWENL